MAERSTVIVRCGGENRGHLKRDGKDPVTNLPVTKVRKCESAFQDETYGKDMRVANWAPSKGAQPDRFRCTVCLKDHFVKS